MQAEHTHDADPLIEQCESVLTTMIEDYHEHNHVHKVTWRIYVMITLTFIFFLAELVTGYLSKSLALQSDAWHMLSDLAALFIGLYSHKVSSKPPNEKMTFGYSRAEVVGGFVNCVFLMAVCLILFLDAIQRFFEVETIEHPVVFFGVGAAGLLVNIIGIFIFHDNHDSDNIRGIFLHIFGDLLGSIAVMISASIVMFTKYSWRFYIDPALSIFTICLIVYSSVKLFKKTLKTLMEECPDSVDVNTIKNEIMELNGVLSVHDLHVWQFSNKKLLGIGHVVLEGNTNVIEKIENIFLKHGICSVTIQIENSDQEQVDEGVCKLASNFNHDNRVFATQPKYEHYIGCPHIHVHNHDDYEHNQSEEHVDQAIEV